MYSTLEGDEFSRKKETGIESDTRVPFAPPQPIFIRSFRTNTKPAAVGGDQVIKLLFMRSV